MPGIIRSFGAAVCVYWAILALGQSECHAQATININPSPPILGGPATYTIQFVTGAPGPIATYYWGKTLAGCSDFGR